MAFHLRLMFSKVGTTHLNNSNNNRNHDDKKKSKYNINIMKRFRSVKSEAGTKVQMLKM